MKRIAAFALTGLLACAALLLASCGNAPSTTLLVYLCGSSLESDYGIASENIDELLNADIPANMHVVIETGGCDSWQSHDIPSDKLARYEVKDHELVEVGQLDLASMGEASTLSDFINFGTTTYPADRTMLLLWDHGGGTLKGACFDEKFGDDKLTLPEMAQGLEEGLAGKRLTAIGFDACLMADYEVAQAAAPHADLLVASQAVEMGAGWDYAALVKTLSQPTDPKALGTSICDAYLAKCAASGKDASATLSAVDLTKFDALQKAFEAFASDLNDEVSVPDGRLALTIAAHSSTSFGTDSSGRMSNLIDLASIAEELAEDDWNTSSGQTSRPESARALAEALGSSVLHVANGPARKDAKGLSVYYPMRYDADEIDAYLALSESENYRSLIDGLYDDVPATTIGLADDGHIADGALQVTLTPESRKYVGYVCCIFSERSEDGSPGMPISITYVEDGNWDTLEFSYAPTGKRLLLDGLDLSFFQADHSESVDTLGALFMLNEELKTFRFARMKDGDSWRYEQLGIVNFDNDLGVPSKDLTPLKPGDVVRMGKEKIVIGANGPTIAEAPLRAGAYTCQLVAVDLFGKEVASKVATFEFDGSTWSSATI